MKTTELDLIEKVSQALAEEFSANFDSSHTVVVYTGKGNNGSDGLGMARILAEWGYNVKIVTLFPKSNCTKENIINFDMLPGNVKVYDQDNLPSLLKEDTIIIDAVFGSGYKGEVTGKLKDIFEIINNSGRSIVSIDIPSGLTASFDKIEGTVIKADFTYCIEFPKLSVLLADNYDYCGELVIIRAGIHNYEFEAQKPIFTYIDENSIKGIIPKRGKFSYKSQFGHALLICGGEGMTGAAVLSTGAALRSGCGLVTVHVSNRESNVIHCTNPCAIVSIDPSTHFSKLPDNISKFSAIGVGCGLGKKPETYSALSSLLDQVSIPIVLDADAINILSASPDLIMKVPKFSIFTPHPGELKRLLGEWSCEKEKYSKAKNFCMQTGNYLVVKGAHTQIYTPEGALYINSSGTPAMSKAGSGDVLTGLITGLLARGLSPLNAAITGVFIHGKAGEVAALEKGVESVNAKDIIDFIRF